MSTMEQAFAPSVGTVVTGESAPPNGLSCPDPPTPHLAPALPPPRRTRRRRPRAPRGHPDPVGRGAQPCTQWVTAPSGSGVREGSRVAPSGSGCPGESGGIPGNPCTQWVRIRVQTLTMPKVPFAHATPKIEHFRKGTYFLAFQKPTPRTKRHFCHRQRLVS